LSDLYSGLDAALIFRTTTETNMKPRLHLWTNCLASVALTHEGYVAAVTKAAAGAVAQGFLFADDAAAPINAAQSSAVP
jgi:hypothetical protein